jgi:hypothetical protein
MTTTPQPLTLPEHGKCAAFVRICHRAGISITSVWDDEAKERTVTVSADGPIPEMVGKWIKWNRSGLLEYLDPANHPAEFNTLEPGEKEQLLDWLLKTFVPEPDRNGNRCRVDTYTLKHVFERECRLYVTNGQFKGALQLLEFPIVDTDEVSWRPRMKRRQACPGLLNGSRSRGLCWHEPDIRTGYCHFHHRKANR